MMRRALAGWLTAPLAAGDAIAAPLLRCERRDAIVVLGAPLAPDGQPGAVVAERVAVAAALWHAGGGARVIVTGGQTRGARRSEAAAMAEALHAAQVDAAAILIEDRARSTADNAAFVRALVPEARAVWLATQRFHGRRAAWLFRAHGFDVRVAHAAEGLERDEPGRAIRWAVREYAAWARALVRRG